MALFRRTTPPAADVPPRDLMAGFGYKTAWLAIEGWPQQDAAALFGLTDQRFVGWDEGIEASYGRDGVVAVTTPITGVGGTWVLVTGTVLMETDPAPNIAGWSEVSAAEVQYFVSHRVPELQGWARATTERGLRAFAWLGQRGEIMANKGDPDPVELAAGFPDRAGSEDALLEAMLESGVDEQTVMAVAEGWSVNPQTLQGQPAAGPLLVGRWPSSALG